MEDSFLSPADVDTSYSSPFKKNFGKEFNPDKSYTIGNQGNANDTFDLLQNGLQQLNLDDNDRSAAADPPVPFKDTTSSTLVLSPRSLPESSGMGVAESKDFAESVLENAEEAVEASVAEKPLTPPSKLTVGNLPPSVFSPMPSQNTSRIDTKTPKQQVPSSDPVSPNSFIRQQEEEVRALQLEIAKIEEDLRNQEAIYKEQLEEADKTILARQQELEKVSKARDNGKERLKKKLQAKMLEEREINELTQQLQEKKDDLDRIVRSNKSSIDEREQIHGDLLAVENAYNDLMKKYQRAKNSILGCNENEIQLRRIDAELLEKVKQKDLKFDHLKSELQDSLEKIFQGLENTAGDKKQEHETLRVRLVRMEMRASTLEKDLEQKSKENAQLHNLCDDIINGRVNK